MYVDNTGGIDDYDEEACRVLIEDKSSKTSLLCRTYAPRISPATLDASRGYRVEQYDRLVCHNEREINATRPVLLVCTVRDIENKVSA